MKTTFNMNLDALNYLLNIAGDYGITNVDVTVTPMKVHNRVTVTIDRDLLTAIYKAAVQYMDEGHGAAAYIEASRAMFGHYPMRLPNRRHA